ncbi:amino acid adenylation domain-containing protein [Xenorhabdus thailandensis]|uniref:amino acid adenylation domain-containing protein n=1 Tax=Xenorhabdus thailandensis TaxID=3136255 RepID=UPI0030F3979A
MTIDLFQPKLVHLMFEEQALKTPHRNAVIQGSESVSYRELNELSNKLSHHLLALGVEKGDSIGICFYPCINTLVCILAILKIGAAYVPFDPMNPSERLILISNQLDNLRYIITNSETHDYFRSDKKQIILTDDLFSHIKSCSNENPAIDMDEDNICYIVFTSGTTGTPKAVAVNHSGWANLLNWFEKKYKLDSESVNVLVSSFGFDISQRSMLSSLYVGSTLIISESKHFDPILIGELINKYHAKTLHLAPSSLYSIIEAWEDINSLPSLRHLFIGGEALSVPRISNWTANENRLRNFIHQYGVAECTDVATSYTMNNFNSYLNNGIPLGEPVSNCNIYVLDEELNSVNIGDIGELVITGDGIGAGYVNNSDLNSERFIKIKINSKLVNAYRTGDFARIRCDGEIICIGRKDNQIKIRGILTNLSDIESVVKSCNSEIKEAIVVPYHENESDIRLCIFLYTDMNESLRPEIKKIKNSIINRLPKHMLPNKFQWLDSFPLTTNGKVNRNALSNLII